MKTIIKRGALWIITVSASLSLTAQNVEEKVSTDKSKFSVGLSLGIANNELTTSTGYRSFTQYGSRNGLSVGIPVKYTITDWFAVQAEPGYIGKGYKYYRTGLYKDIYNQRTMNGYINLPVMAQFSFGGEKLRGFVNAGVFGGYWLKSFVKGQIQEWTTTLDDEPHFYNFKESVSFDKRRDNRFEAGLLTGAGIQYDLAPQYTVFVEARYYYSTTDLQKSYMKDQISRYNNTWVFSTGIIVKL